MASLNFLATWKRSTTALALGSILRQAAWNGLPMSARYAWARCRCPSDSFSRHFWAAASSRPSATASTSGRSGSVRSVRMVTYSLCRFFRLNSSIPTSAITRPGSICLALASASWFLTIRPTVSAEMASRRATSSSLLPISDRRTCCSKR
jgi:hypothetical protein